MQKTLMEWSLQLHGAELSDANELVDSNQCAVDKAWRC